MMDEKDKAQAELAKLKQTFRTGVYSHYKGHLYTVYAFSVKEDTCELLVHYYSQERHTRWTRTVQDFTQFVPESNMVRFRFVHDASLDQLLTAVGYDIPIP